MDEILHFAGMSSSDPLINQQIEERLVQAVVHFCNAVKPLDVAAATEWLKVHVPPNVLGMVQQRLSPAYPRSNAGQGTSSSPYYVEDADVDMSSAAAAPVAVKHEAPGSQWNPVVVKHEAVASGLPGSHRKPVLAKHEAASRGAGSEWNPILVKDETPVASGGAGSSWNPISVHDDSVESTPGQVYVVPYHAPAAAPVFPAYQSSASMPSSLPVSMPYPSMSGPSSDYFTGAIPLSAQSSSREFGKTYKESVKVIEDAKTAAVEKIQARQKEAADRLAKAAQRLSAASPENAGDYATFYRIVREYKTVVPALLGLYLYRHQGFSGPKPHGMDEFMQSFAHGIRNLTWNDIESMLVQYLVDNDLSDEKRGMAAQILFQLKNVKPEDSEMPALARVVALLQGGGSAGGRKAKGKTKLRSKTRSRSKGRKLRRRSRSRSKAKKLRRRSGSVKLRRN